MRKVFLVIIAIVLFGSTAARAHDVLVIQGQHVKPFDEALRGFRSACDADTKRLYLPDLDGTDIVRMVREEKPRLILAIGGEALKKVRPVRDVPIVYLMVVTPQQIVKGNRNVTGVAMNLAPEKFLDLMARMSPRPKVVGIIYDPAKTGHLVKRAQQAARARGIELAAREVSTSREVPETLNGMKGVIDLLWLLPDTTVITPETVEHFLLVSQESRVPVISFAAKYVEMGALAALDINGFDQGKQAGEMAARILSGTAVSELPGADARGAAVKVNRSVAKKFGITLESSPNQQ
ncbi:MAG: ABC transporter substrate-binding protein [Geobacteraceae bacterium]|nr:ABC transporter substrate-binding protein [Geobacteraceae bacterium]